MHTENRIVVVVQARQGSSRLPGKSLRVVAGRPLIEHVLQRACLMRTPTAVVLATSDHERDDGLAFDVAQRSVPVVRGPELDVLRRVQMVAELWGAATIVRVTGDCPFLDPDVADAVVEQYLRCRRSPRGAEYAEYVSNDTTRSGYPDGTDVEVFSRDALDMAASCATAPTDREHVTSWIRRTGRCAILRSAVDYTRYKLSVDTMADYELACRIAAVPPDDLTVRATVEAADHVFAQREV